MCAYKHRKSLNGYILNENCQSEVKNQERLSLSALHIFQVFECYLSIYYIANDKSTNRWKSFNQMGQKTYRLQLYSSYVFYILYMSPFCLFSTKANPSLVLYPGKLSVFDNISE